MMNKIDQAIDCFAQGFSCSQAILSTYGADLGLDRETALRVAGGFGGGMARMAETCGAVTGAFMVIGLKHGMTKVEDQGAKTKTYKLIQEFVKRFKAHNSGTIICRELLGCDLSTSEGMRLFSEKDLIHTKCPKFISDSAEIIEELL
jgi:C_GCAxxG_C_C family probable redox protein